MINLNHPLETHKSMMAPLNGIRHDSIMQRRTLAQKVEVSITSLVFVTLVLVGIISLAYLIHSNRNATKGYALKTLELERSKLLTENEVWDMQIARVKSLEILQNDPKIRAMVRAETPQFIRGDTAIAAR